MLSLKVIIGDAGTLAALWSFLCSPSYKLYFVSPQKESVALAARLIDESELRGYKLHVEAARFELKGQYDASKKKKKSKDYRKKMQQQQK